MEHESEGSIGWLAVFCVLMLAMMYFLAASAVAFSPMFVAILLLVCLFTMFRMLTGAERRQSGEAVPPPIPTITVAPSVRLDDIFRVESQTSIDEGFVLGGKFRTDVSTAQRELQKRYAASGYVPALREDGNGQPAIVLIPARTWPAGQDASTFPWTNIALLAATLATTTWAGALHAGVDVLAQPARITVGFPYALALIAILGTHELGHYFAARYHGMRVSLPYFIPVPFALGTFGAFIQLKSPAHDRRALFDMAVAGPLAGLAIAIPALVIGLKNSQVIAGPAPGEQIHQGVDAGSSMLLAAVARLTMGDTLLAGHAVQLHPIAFAGWLGIFITALNLIPIGQLDGGHIADAMFGPRRSALINSAVLFSLFFLGIFVWAGFLVWAFLIYLMAGRKGLTALDALTPLSTGRTAVGWFAYALLASILLPVPHGFYGSFGIHCPFI